MITQQQYNELSKEDREKYKSFVRNRIETLNGYLAKRDDREQHIKENYTKGVASAMERLEHEIKNLRKNKDTELHKLQQMNKWDMFNESA